MGFRLGLILLLVAFAVTAESSSPFRYKQWDTVARFDLRSAHSRACKGRVGDCIDEAEEMMMDSESSRRVLAGRNYISYAALRKNNVPCNRRGHSYYNCGSTRRANPYRRGCSAITRCARRRGGCNKPCIPLSSFLVKQR